MVKVRIQILAGEQPGKQFSPLKVAGDIIAKDGSFFSLYRG